MDSPNVSGLLQRAAQAVAGKDFWQAIEFYTDLLGETDPQTGDTAVKEQRLEALRERSRLLNILGSQEAALAGYEQYYLEAGSGIQAVDALVKIGRQSVSLGRYKRALQAQEEALELAVALNYSRGRAQALNGIGRVYFRLEQDEEALVHFRQALAIFEQLKDELGQMETWNLIGVTRMMRLGEADKGIAAFQAALKFARDIGDHETAMALNNLGESFQNLFAMDRAVVCHEEGLQLAEHSHLRAIEADLCRNMGVDLCYLDRVDEGITYLYRSLALSEETKQPDIYAQALFSLARGELQRGDVTAARQHAEILEEVGRDRERRSSLANALYVQGLIHQHEGDTATAERLWQEVSFIAHETGQRMLLWQTHAALANISNNPGLVSVHRQIAAEVIQQIVFPIEDEALCQTFLNAPEVQAVLSEAGADS